MYKLTIVWSDDECVDETTHDNVQKAADYLSEEGRRASEAAIAILAGREPDGSYTAGYGGKVAITIVEAIIKEES